MAEKTAKKVTTEAKASEKKENIFKRFWKWVCIHKWWILGIGGTAAVSGTGGFVAGRLSKKDNVSDGSEGASVDVTSCTTAEDSVEE
jgi:hypothetical protein